MIYPLRGIYKINITEKLLRLYLFLNILIVLDKLEIIIIKINKCLYFLFNYNI